MARRNVRQFKALSLVIFALMISACGRFETTSLEKVTATADPLTAEKEDQAQSKKTAAPVKPVPAEVNDLFARERALSDSDLMDATKKNESIAAKAQAAVSIASVHRFNAIIEKRRFELLRLADLASKSQTSKDVTVKAGKEAISKVEQAWLKDLAAEFKVAGATPTAELRLRVDGWPASLVLASLFVDGVVNPKVGATEKEVSDRMTLFNTSDDRAMTVIRWQRSLLNANAKMTAVDKAKMLAPEFAKALAQADREPFIKLVSELAIIEGASK